MKKNKIHFFEDVTIGNMVAEGNCIAYKDGKIIFVRHAAPGDIANVKVLKHKKKVYHTSIIELKENSPLRIAAQCKHYTYCGGCKWQHVSYEEQLKMKQDQVYEQLTRIGGLSDFEVMPIIGCENQFHYRNKVDLTFSNRAWQIELNKEAAPKNALGFHIPGAFDKVLDLEQCLLMPELLMQIKNTVANFAETNGYTFFDLRQQQGFLRNLMVRCNIANEWMCIFSFFENDPDKINSLLSHIQQQFPQIVSLQYCINKKKNDSLTDLEMITFGGEDFLTEKLGNYTFKIQAQSFFQTNSKQAKILYDVALDFAQLTGSETVYDLYTGTGSIAIYVSQFAKKIVGIEYVPEAIVDAIENAQNNGVHNCDFFAGDMKEILTADFITENGTPDVIITDPPREGMHADVVQRLLESGAKRIVYVSCNPATQARDAQLLSEKYKLIKVQPVDMFPQTHHVENVGLFELRV